MSKKKVLKRVIAITIAILLVGLAVWYFVQKNGVRRAIPGIGEPVQEETTGSTTKTVDGYNVTITYKYTYEIEALVVHTKAYDGSSFADKMSPLDAALAWGKVAQYNKKIDFNWSQSGRWYSWHVDDVSVLAPVGGTSYVNEHSANTHLLPSSSTVKDKVKKIRRGDHIRLKGYLVDVDAEKSNGDTYWWHSSTTRTDTGDGACEVMYVTDVEWLD